MNEALVNPFFAAMASTLSVRSFVILIENVLLKMGFTGVGLFII